MDDKHLVRFYASLTKRQQQVLQLVCRGLTNREIADWLYIEPCVVAGHLTNIYELVHILMDKHYSNRPNRYLIIRHFSSFFIHHSEFDQFIIQEEKTKI